MGNINLGFTEGQGKNCVYKDENVIDGSCKGKVAIYDENVMLRSATANYNNDPSCVVNNKQLYTSYYDLSIYEDAVFDKDPGEDLNAMLSMLFMLVTRNTVRTNNVIDITFRVWPEILSGFENDDVVFTIKDNVCDGYCIPLAYIKEEALPMKMSGIFIPVYAKRTVKNGDDEYYIMEPTTYICYIETKHDNDEIRYMLKIGGLPQKWSMLRSGLNNEIHYIDELFISTTYVVTPENSDEVSAYKYNLL